MSVQTFEYKAFGADGVGSRGFAEASTKQEAFRQLQARGLTPVTLREARSHRTRGVRIASKELAHFTYQLGVLLNAKVQLAEGLLSIAEQEREGPLRSVVEDVARRVTAGESVSAALEAHRETFGDVFVESVRASEKTGTLAAILDHLADMLERSQEATRQVRGALLYPITVSAVLAFASIFLIGVIVPKFGEMFAQRGASLPTLTRVLMEVGLSVRSYWWAYLIGAGGIGVAAYSAGRSTMGRRTLDAIAHRIPYIERILRGLGVSRFSRVLGIALSSGIGLVEALQLAGKASGRIILMEEIAGVVSNLRAGGRLTDCLRQSRYFPVFAKRMLAAGDQSGEIPRMCEIVSRHYERECQHLTKDLSGVLEPVLIVAIAGVVLVIALSVFLPMWDMARVVGS